MNISHYFWDSCVFIAYLNNAQDAYDIASLEKFISELRQSKCKIYTSAVSLAEITPEHLKNSDYGDFESFLDNFQKSIFIVNTTHLIYSRAGRLRDVKYKKGDSKNRNLTLGDAIMLASALELEDTYDIKLDAFHTYDDSRSGKGPEGKGIPLLSYHEWLEDVEVDGDIAKVVKLNRCEPIHSAPELSLE